MSGQHDAASVVGAMSGLGSTGRGQGDKPVSPTDLAGRFCTERQPEVDAERGITTYKGWCGYTGARGTDPMRVGFDDGYDFLGGMADRGWTPISEKGSWPLVVFMRWGRNGENAIAEYCEADVTIYVYDSEAAMRQHYTELRDEDDY